VDRAPEWHAGHAFELIADLFQNYAMPPLVAARLYQALAAVSGVIAHADALDAAGQRGTGFLLAGTAGGNQEIIVHPRSFQFQGYQFLAQGQDLHAGGAHQPGASAVQRGALWQVVVELDAQHDPECLSDRVVSHHLSFRQASVQIRSGEQAMALMTNPYTMG
jgi:cold shock CspA family protein